MAKRKTDTCRLNYDPRFGVLVLGAEAMSEKSCDNCGNDDPLEYCGRAVNGSCRNNEHWVSTSVEKPIDWSEVGPMLLEALDGLVLVCGRTGNALYDFEEQAEAFQKETGKMRPGKDVPAVCTELAATMEDFKQWVDKKVNSAREAIAMARGRG